MNESKQANYKGVFRSNNLKIFFLSPVNTIDQNYNFEKTSKRKIFCIILFNFFRSASSFKYSATISFPEFYMAIYSVGLFDISILEKLLGGIWEYPTRMLKVILKNAISMGFISTWNQIFSYLFPIILKVFF